MTRYFKKTTPEIKLGLSNGQAAVFETLTPQVGVMKTQNPWLMKEMDDAMAGHRGGVEEITEADYLNLKKKLSGIVSKPPQREEMSAQSFGVFSRRKPEVAGRAVINQTDEPEGSNPPVETEVARPKSREKR